jgi:hypothetical protein
MSKDIIDNIMGDYMMYGLEETTLTSKVKLHTTHFDDIHTIMLETDCCAKCAAFALNKYDNIVDAILNVYDYSFDRGGLCKTCRPIISGVSKETNDNVTSQHIGGYVYCPYPSIFAKSH